MLLVFAPSPIFITISDSFVVARSSDVIRP